MAFIASFWENVFDPSTKNRVKESVSAMSTAITSSFQGCTTEAGQFQECNIVNIGGKEENVTCDATNTAYTNFSCTSSSETQSQLTTELQQNATQIAKAIAQQLELAAPKAENVGKLYANVATEIQNVYTQKCLQIIQQTQYGNSINIGGIVNGVTIDLDNTLNETLNCVLTDSTVNDIEDSIAQTINQEATAEVENFLWPIVIIAAIILGILALLLFVPGLFRKKEAGPPTAGQEGYQAGLEETLAEGLAPPAAPPGGEPSTESLLALVPEFF